MAGKPHSAAKRRFWPDIRGAMAGLIRTHEWRHTPLGETANWPQSLKTAVELMLHTHQPASVSWGRSLNTLYNDAAIPHLKGRHPDCLGKPYREVWPECWEDVKPAIDAAFSGEPQQLIGQRNRLSGGTEVASWFTWSWSPLRDDAGQITGIFCSAAETVLNLGDEQLRTVLENARDGVLMMDVRSRKYVYVSPALVAQTGFTLDELRSMSDEERLERIHPDDRAAYLKTIDTLTSGASSEAVIEQRWRFKTGEYRWFAISHKLVRNAAGVPFAIVSVCRDATERKQAEAALRQSEMRFKLATEAAEIGTWEWDFESNKVVRNPFIYELLGIPPQAADDPADTFLRMIHPEDVGRVRRELDEAHNSGTAWRSEFRVVRPDGETRWLVGSGRVVRNPDGSVRAMHGVNYDITEQKRAEAALAASEKRYRLLHETQRDGFVMTSMDGVIRECNDIFCRMLGYSAEELGRMTYFDLTPERWHAAEAVLVRDQILQRGYSDVYEKEYRRKDGTIFPVELRTILSRDDAGNPDGMWAIIRDITRRKANEARLFALNEELIHVGRVSELSQVSAGIAHELNQPLAAMVNYAATAKRLIAGNDGTAALKAINRASEQAERAAEIIHRIRNFVERHESRRHAVAMNAIIHDAVALGLIGAKAGGIKTRLELSDGLPDVVVDPVQIQQVLVNLLRNAVDAMSQAPERVLTLTSARHADAITVAVGDTGCGIPKHMLDQLFLPFVTNKPGGMGIGLAISRSIIEAHGGTIAAEPNPGGGTVFRFRLPVGQVAH